MKTKILRTTTGRIIGTGWQGARLGRRRVCCAAGLFLAFVGLWMAGCVPSLNPLYTDKDLVFEPGLVGTWEDVEGKDEVVWAFEKGADTSYGLSLMKGAENIGQFEARLVRLDGKLFLDLFPEATAFRKLPADDFYKGHFAAAHTFLRVFQVQPELRMSILSPEWLEGLLKENPAALAHVMTGAGTGQDERLVLTASTAELQAFFIKHADDPKAFGDPTRLRKRAAHARAAAAEGGVLGLAAAGGQ